jgi:hypothetical protein
MQRAAVKIATAKRRALPLDNERLQNKMNVSKVCRGTERNIFAQILSEHFGDVGLLVQAGIVVQTK